jgi:phytoene dehydrogenase-like protein
VRARYDAVVIGAGPNGLAAGIVLARAGWSVLVREAAAQIGGGIRVKELTLPGFTHDVCSAIHPLALSSPVFRALPLQDHGLEWIQPPAPVAHPFEDGSAVVMARSVDETAARLAGDAPKYRTLFARLRNHWENLSEDILGPLRVPRHPVRLAQFALDALRSAEEFARARFGGRDARALFAGHAAHAQLPLEQLGTARSAWFFARVPMP